jgi:methyl-accepting chemotaxis protein
METLLIIFIAVTAIAVVLQAAILFALFLTMKKSADKMEAIAEEVKSKTLPSIESATAMLTDLRPKIEQLADNLVQLHPKISRILDDVTEITPKIRSVVENTLEATGQVRGQVQRIDAALNDAVDRARLQVIRADEMVTRTFDRLEHTSELVSNTVVSPVKQVSGIFRGITAGVEFLLKNRERKNGNGRESRRAVPQDEMFI